VVHLLFGEATEHERASIDSGRGVPLHKYKVAAVLGRRRVPEMIVADVVERRRGGEACDVAADVGVLVGADHHRHRIPAHVRADAVLDRLVTGNPDLLVDGNGIDVRGVGRERHVRAGAARLVDYLLDEEMRAVRPLVFEHTVNRIQPFLGFLRVDVRVHVHGVFLTVMAAMRVDRTLT
jgi:hypothetical protein